MKTELCGNRVQSGERRNKGTRPGGNAKRVIDQLPEDAEIIFGPDYNLGNYINGVTGRKMLLWNGGYHVHERFSVEKIIEFLCYLRLVLSESPFDIR